MVSEKFGRGASIFVNTPASAGWSLSRDPAWLSSASSAMSAITARASLSLKALTNFSKAARTAAASSRPACAPCARARPGAAPCASDRANSNSVAQT